MFTHFKNIDSSFRHIRLFSIVLIIANVIICCFNIYSSSVSLSTERNRVYILAFGKLLEANGTDRRNVIEIEVRDHVKDFHHYFFTASPDEQVIKRNITKALYLSDQSVKREYDNLTEAGYYNSLVSSNISQSIEEDSIAVNTLNLPITFTYYGKIRIVRTTSILTRSIITVGQIRLNVEKSDNNPHGMLLENWKIISNQDLTLQKR